MKKIIIIAVIVILLLGIVLGIFFFLLSGGSSSVGSGAELTDGEELVEEMVEKPEPMYLEIRPPFVVTLLSEEKSYFLQVETALLAYEKEDFEALEKNQPAIKAALVDLYSTQDITYIKTKEGKDELKEVALEKVKDVMMQAYGKSAVEAVYFTKFVIQ